MTSARSILRAHPRLIAGLITAAILITILTATVTGGSGRPAPITPTLLRQAAHAAQAATGGYDYSCHIYGAPRQVLCEGQGNPVTFLVTASGQLQLEP